MCRKIGHGSLIVGEENCNYLQGFLSRLSKEHISKWQWYLMLRDDFALRRCTMYCLNEKLWDWAKIEYHKHTKKRINEGRKIFLWTYCYELKNWVQLLCFCSKYYRHKNLQDLPRADDIKKVKLCLFNSCLLL